MTKTTVTIPADLALLANEASFSFNLCGATPVVITHLKEWDLTEEEYREWLEEHEVIEDKPLHEMWENGWEFTYEEACEYRSKFLKAKERLDKYFS